MWGSRAGKVWIAQVVAKRMDSPLAVLRSVASSKLVSGAPPQTSCISGSQARESAFSKFFR